MTNKETVFSKDLKNRKLTVVHTFDAPLDIIWKAWSEAEILDQWWGPKPYRAETKKMDFRPGGQWLYSMVGPEDFRQWCRVDYTAIEPQKTVTESAHFCDEHGKINPDFPTMHWKKEFASSGNRVTVKVEISFDHDADLETFLKTGFQEGFTAGLGNLDEYLSAHVAV